MNVIPFDRAVRLSVAVDEIYRQADNLLRARHGDYEDAINDARLTIFCVETKDAPFWESVVQEIEFRRGVAG